MGKQIKVVVVGMGKRANIYSSYSLKYPERLKIVGVVDPDPVRIELAKKRFGVPQENCFTNLEDFIQRDKFADAVINGTLDHLHVVTSIPILRKGYDLLLEKPFAVNQEEMEQLVRVTNEEKRKVVICHVLRYTPFYRSIKEHLLKKEIGDIIHIEMAEHVSYHHMAVSYVRGKWRSPKLCHAPMLLAKSCHDLDIMSWMLGNLKPIAVASFGNDAQFLPDKKPEGAGSRCMADCPYVESCRFSAYTNYIAHPIRWSNYTWRCLEAEGETDIMRKIASMRTDNPYGKCVWDCERDGNVDHQSVVIHFENSVIGTFNMVGGTAVPERKIRIIGTLGEITGTFETSTYTVRKIDAASASGYSEETYDLKVSGDMVGAFGGHGGGDERLVEDFVEYMNGAEPSVSCTDLNDSVLSHRLVFTAESSRKTGKIEWLKK